MDFSETRRHQRDKTPRWCRGERATTGADQTPPAAGCQRVFVGASGGVIACSLDCVWSLAIAGAQETGACSRLSLPVPGPRGGRGHTCRTPPRAGSVRNAILTIKKGTSGSARAPMPRGVRDGLRLPCGAALAHWPLLDSNRMGAHTAMCAGEILVLLSISLPLLQLTPATEGVELFVRLGVCVSFWLPSTPAGRRRGHCGTSSAQHRHRRNQTGKRPPWLSAFHITAASTNTNKHTEDILEYVEFQTETRNELEDETSHDEVTDHLFRHA